MQETCRLGRFQVLFFSFLLTAEVYAELFLFPIICAVPSLHRRERQCSFLRARRCMHRRRSSFRRRSIFLPSGPGS